MSRIELWHLQCTAVMIATAVNACMTVVSFSKGSDSLWSGSFSGHDTVQHVVPKWWAGGNEEVGRAGLFWLWLAQGAVDFLTVLDKTPPANTLTLLSLFWQWGKTKAGKGRWEERRARRCDRKLHHRNIVRIIKERGQQKTAANAAKK